MSSMRRVNIVKSDLGRIRPQSNFHLFVMIDEAESERLGTRVAVLLTLILPAVRLRKVLFSLTFIF